MNIILFLNDNIPIILNKNLINYIHNYLQLSYTDKLFIIHKNTINDILLNDNIILISNYKFNNFIEQLKNCIEQILKYYITPNEKCIIITSNIFYTENILNLYNNIGGNAIFYTTSIKFNPLFMSYITINNNLLIDITQLKISDYISVGAYCFENINKVLSYCDNILIQQLDYTITKLVQEMIKTEQVNTIKLDSSYIFDISTPQLINDYINNCHIFLFDLDGTMVLTDSIYIKVWNKLLKNYNINIDDNIYYKYINGNSDETVLRSLINNISNIQEISLQKDKLFIENSNLIEKVEGIDNFLKLIKLTGHHYSIVTNCNRTVAEHIIKICNFSPDYLVIGQECNRPKPYGDPYLKAIMNYNSSNNKCIIFEDSFSGLISASSNNPKCIIGLETRYNNIELLTHGANFSIRNYDKLNINYILQYTNININLISDYIKLSLQNSFNIIDIKISNEKLKGGFISDVIKVDIITSEKILYCVLKLENKNKTFLSKMANELCLYEREYYFYESISKFININIPKYIGLIKDNEFNNIGILLEDQLHYNNIIGLNLNNESIDIGLNIINNLAKFHSKFWNKNLNTNFPLLKKHNDSMFQPKWYNFICSKIDIYKQKWSNILSSSDLIKTDFIVESFLDIQNRLSSGHLTLCHGDVKAPNIFFTNTKDPIFIDWQYIAIGKGVQDLVFFMIESYDIHKINQYMNIFKNYYYIKLLEYDIKSYDIQEYEQDFIDAICYFPFFVAVWFGSLNEDELIDKNFPVFFITKLYNFINNFVLFKINCRL